MKWYRLLLLIPLVALALVLQAAYARMVPLTTGNPAHDHQIAALDGRHRIGQTFNAPYPGLVEIRVHLTNYGKPVDRPIVFHLKRNPWDDRDLATAVVQAKDVPDNSWVSFTFPPVDLPRQTLYFELTTPLTGTVGTVGVTAASRNPYTGGHLVVDGTPVEADLHFFAVFKPDPWTLTQIVLDRMTAKKPGIWGKPWFYVALFVAYIVATLTLGWRVLDFVCQPESSTAAPAPHRTEPADVATR